VLEPLQFLLVPFNLFLKRREPSWMKMHVLMRVVMYFWMLCAIPRSDGLPVLFGIAIERDGG